MAPDASELELIERPNGVELAVKVVPGASRTKIVGVWNRALRLVVAAPPEGGKANAAVCQVLAEACGVRRADVELISGHTRPVKRILLGGTNAGTVRTRLRALLTD